jgi:hypothetical protein
VYDTRNDNDTLYYQPNICFGPCGPGPGYSGANTHNPVDLDLPEGRSLTIAVWDDANLTRLVDEIGFAVA